MAHNKKYRNVEERRIKKDIYWRFCRAFADNTKFIRLRKEVLKDISYTGIKKIKMMRKYKALLKRRKRRRNKKW